MYVFFIFCKVLKLVLFLYFHPIKIVGNNLLVGKSHILCEVGGTNSADSDPMSFLSMSDSSWICDTLKIWNILTEIFILCTSFTILFCRKRLSIGFAEIPWFYRNSIIGDNLSIGSIYETRSKRTSFLISISKIFLEFIRIIGSIIIFSREFTIFWLTVKIRI